MKNGIDYIMTCFQDFNPPGKLKAIQITFKGKKITNRNDVEELYETGKGKLIKYLIDNTPPPHSGRDITLWKPHQDMNNYIPIFPKRIEESW
ncbi:MAG: hypothetical protein P8X70_01960 [Nanoarchaeota archaeon]